MESLRDRIAAGRGGKDGYEEALALLASDPGGGCVEWLAEGAVQGADDPALQESLRGLCGDGASAGGGPSDRDRGKGPGKLHFTMAASQTVRPQGAGRDDAGWSIGGQSPGAALEASGRGAALRRRRLRLGGAGWTVQAGQLARSWEDTRVACVAGRTAFAGSAARSGLGGPLASAHPGLDGLSLGLRSGPWRAQAAAAWNRLAPDRPVRRDAGTLVAGLAHAPAGGPEIRAQALMVRLEPGPGRREWLAVAGAGIRRGGPVRRWRAAAAVSGGSSARPGGYAEAAFGGREDGGPLVGPDSIPEPDPDPGNGRWEWSLRQAAGGWANPLQSGASSLRDTGGGWAATPWRGGMRAGSAFPLARTGGYAAGLEVSAAMDWAAGDAADPPYPEADPAPDWESLRAETRLIQIWGPWTWTSGASLETGRPGHSRGSAGWKTSWHWGGGPWRASAALSRRSGIDAGSRPMPMELALARHSPHPGSHVWVLGWSAADARRPGRAQRLDLRQTWPGGKGMRVEQRLRVPWGGARRAAGETSYQLGLAAEF